MASEPSPTTAQPSFLPGGSGTRTCALAPLLAIGAVARPAAAVFRKCRRDRGSLGMARHDSPNAKCRVLSAECSSLPLHSALPTQHLALLMFAVRAALEFGEEHLPRVAELLTRADLGRVI